MLLNDIRFFATTASLAVAACYGLCLVLRSRRVSFRPSKTLLALFLTIFVPSFVQVFLWNGLYDYLSRDAELIASGQLWRLLTSVMVQSGNIPGLLFNLACFVVLVPLSLRILGTRQTLAFFFIGVIAGELAGLVWLPVGGGNSVGNYGVAAGIMGYMVVFARPPVKVLAAASSLLTIMMMSLMDIHGAAFSAALLCALGYYYAGSKKKPAPRALKRVARAAARA